MPRSFPKTRAFLWKRDTLLLLDQRRLPHEQVWKTCRRWTDVARGIRDMVVRGAPAIGCVAAYGMVLASRDADRLPVRQRGALLEKAHAGLLAARPTAVNLRWALERLRLLWNAGTARLAREAFDIEEEDRAGNRRIGAYGAALLPPGATVLTICNTGSLATAGLGTAFGVLWTASRQGRLQKVLVCETRPYLQGARLTAWELAQEKIPFELITDGMAAHLMKTERVDAVIAGADRIAANGDSANKIGTYALAVLALHHKIPFYIAAPFSTVDLSTPSGESIPIEERSSEEVVVLDGRRIAPKGTRARHPAFDISPSPLIRAIMTDRGVAEAPYRDALRRLALGHAPSDAQTLVAVPA